MITETLNKTKAETKTYRTCIEPLLGSALFERISQMDFLDDYVELVITGVPTTKDGKPIWELFFIHCFNIFYLSDY